MNKIKLNNNYEMPIIGLGTWRSKPEDAYKAVLVALEKGYRHIDTAAVYGNEEMIGKAIFDSQVKREDLFITTKVWNTDQGYENTLKAFSESIKKLGVDYVDLYLIHWFKGYENSLSTYKALEDLYRQGKVKAIGVCNYNVHHLQHLLDNVEIKPMVNQVETHVTLQNHFLHDFCKANNIQLEAYAPLMSRKIDELLTNETLNEIANKYNKTVPQIAIRWLIERGIVVIPKSVTPERIESNFDVFDFTLSKEDMDKIRKINTGRKLFPEMDNIDF
ncbi:MAG: aldo/keto reductase [Candidatus Izemoplasmatales bacterium]|nr:aldo/keto reductase [Candidatus Izemoplasmatales bacterium]MDD4069222.1 aldo/keto reductase [Candidatus Izemoplasmatales bacterium]